MERKNYSISCIRFVSLLLIVICHFMLYYNYWLAWWFNVGVQIFLCISGYLYGQRSISDIPAFIIKRIKKIIVPYYLIFVTVAILHYLFVRECIDLDIFVGGLLLKKFLNGGEHFWFIPVITICYAVSILLDRFKEKYVKNSDSFFIFSVVSVVVALVVFGLVFSYYKTDCIVCFILGYCLGVNDTGKYIPTKFNVGLFSFFAIIGNGLQIYFTYFRMIIIPQEFFELYRVFRYCNHVTLGIILFIVLKLLFDKVQFRPKMLAFLDKADNYSYEVYLVHQFLILGPFSLMEITGFLPINLIIIILLTVALAFLLKLIDSHIFVRNTKKSA